MVPGFDKPSFALRSEKELIASPNAVAIGFEKRMDLTGSNAEEAMTTVAEVRLDNGLEDGRRRTKERDRRKERRTRGDMED